MNRLTIVLAAGVLALSANAAQAARIDLTKYTCGEYAALKAPARANVVLLTVGYMMGRQNRSQFSDRVVLDTNGARNFAIQMAALCANQPKQTWLAAIQKAFTPKRKK